MVVINICITNVESNCIANESAVLEKTSQSMKETKTDKIMPTTTVPFHSFMTKITSTVAPIPSEFPTSSFPGCLDLNYYVIFKKFLCFNPEAIKKNGKLISKTHIVVLNEKTKCACARKCLNSNGCTYFEVIRNSNACSLYQYNFNLEYVEEGKGLKVNPTMNCGFIQKYYVYNYYYNY